MAALEAGARSLLASENGTVSMSAAVAAAAQAESMSPDAISRILRAAAAAAASPAPEGVSAAGGASLLGLEVTGPTNGGHRDLSTETGRVVADEEGGFGRRRTWSGLKPARRSGGGVQRQSREGELAERTSRGQSMHLSASQRALLRATKKMNFPGGKSEGERQERFLELAKNKPVENYLEECPSYVARRKKDGYSEKSAFTSMDEVKNCTFIPKIGRPPAEGGRDDGEEKKDDLDPMEHFVKRQDAWTRKMREDLSTARGKEAYEALLTRKICPDCKHPDGKPVYQVTSAAGCSVVAFQTCFILPLSSLRRLMTNSSRSATFGASAFSAVCSSCRHSVVVILISFVAFRL